MTNHSDIVSEAAKAAPAVTVSGLTLFGVSLSDWVLLTTLIYTVLQVFLLLRGLCYKPGKAQHGSK